MVSFDIILPCIKSDRYLVEYTSVRYWTPITIISYTPSDLISFNIDPIWPLSLRELSNIFSIFAWYRVVIILIVNPSLVLKVFHIHAISPSKQLRLERVGRKKANIYVMKTRRIQDNFWGDVIWSNNYSYSKYSERQAWANTVDQVRRRRTQRLIWACTVCHSSNNFTHIHR